MALSNAEKVTLKVIVGIDDDTELSFLLSYIDNSNLATETYAAMSTDIATWLELQDEHDTIEGGKYGISSRPSRTRDEIKRRLMIHLRMNESASIGAGSMMVRI